MRLNSKIALILIVQLLPLLGILAWGIHSQIVERFAKLEQNHQQEDHQRLQHAIASDLDNLSRTTLDWAAFDDTYNYLQGQNSGYRQANLNAMSLRALKLDGILLYDSQQRLHSQYANNPHQPNSRELPNALLQQITSNLPATPQHNSQQGILSYHGHILELASSPITTSDASAKPLGTLVLLRYLDQNAINSLAKRLKLTLQITPLQGPGSIQVAPSILNGLQKQPLWLQADDEQNSSSYSMLKDLAGNPVLLMRASMPRDIYREGLKTATEMLIFIAAALLLFVGSTFLAIHLTALKRLSLLSKRLQSIGASGSSQERLLTRGNDEISLVAQAANSMLDNLERGFEQRRSASELQRKLNALLVRIATDEDVDRGDSHALFQLISSALQAISCLRDWSLWLSVEDGQGFTCLHSSQSVPELIESSVLQQLLTSHDHGLPDQLPYPNACGLILPFHVDSRLGALCVQTREPLAPDSHAEVDFLLAATQLIERSLRSHLQSLREQDLRQRAETDTLTGLANRSTFELKLQQAFRQPLENGTQIGLLFIDLDRFKQINDTHGHDVGDWLLVEVAARLRTQVRANDLVARLGGDEFTVILNDLHEHEDACRIAEKICQALGEPFIHPSMTLHSGASIGLAWAPSHGRNAAELVKAADLAMYAAKQRGRGNWISASALPE